MCDLKKRTHIFIDTSVFQAEGFLKESSRVSKLFGLAAKGHLTILLPEITKRRMAQTFFVRRLFYQLMNSNEE